MRIYKNAKQQRVESQNHYDPGGQISVTVLLRSRLPPGSWPEIDEYPATAAALRSAGCTVRLLPDCAAAAAAPDSKDALGAAPPRTPIEDRLRAAEAAVSLSKEPDLRDTGGSSSAIPLAPEIVRFLSSSICNPLRAALTLTVDGRENVARIDAADLAESLRFRIGKDIR